MQKRNQTKVYGVFILVFLISGSLLSGQTLSMNMWPVEPGKVNYQPLSLSEVYMIESEVLPSRDIDLNPQVQKSQPVVLIAHPAPRRLKLGDAMFEASMISLIALNAADFYSTKQALKYSGVYEANPIMQPVVKNDWAFAAVKVGTTLGSYFVFKSLYKKNKPLAWILSIGTNFALSYVVSHNMKIMNQARGMN